MILSRVANNAYWFSRYSERADNMCRLVSAMSAAMMDTPKSMPVSWGSLLDILGCKAIYDKKHDIADEYNVMSFILRSEHNPGSIMQSIGYARENGRASRDFMPIKAWEQINAAHHFIKENAATANDRTTRLRLSGQLTDRFDLLHGVIDHSTLHDTCYQFFKLGMLIERADMTTRILDVWANCTAKISDSDLDYERVMCMSTLNSLNAYQMFRRSTQSDIKVPAVIKFLLKDKRFPRSFAFCLEAAKISLEKLPPSPEGIECISSLQTIISEYDVDKLTAEDHHKLFDLLQIELSEMHKILENCYFNQTHEASVAT